MGIALSNNMTSLTNNDMFAVNAGGSVADAFYSAASWGVKATGFCATVSAASAPVPVVAEVAGGLAIIGVVSSAALYGSAVLADFMGL